MHHPTVIYIDIVMPRLNALSFSEVFFHVGSSTPEKSPPAPHPPHHNPGGRGHLGAGGSRQQVDRVMVFPGRRHPYARNESTNHDVRDPLLVVGWNRG